MDVSIMGFLCKQLSCGGILMALSSTAMGE